MAEKGTNGTTSQPSLNKSKSSKKSGKGRRKKSGSTSNKSKFKRAIAELNGHVFEVYSESVKSSQFQHTADELSMNMARKYEHGGDISMMLSDMEEFDFNGALVDILVRANPKYKKFVHINKQGKKMMYLQLRKALYGTLTAARLFWENITDKL